MQQQEVTIAQQDRKIQEQEAMITQLEKGMKTVIARLEEQAAHIQKVSAQLAARSEFVRTGGFEVSKFATGRIRPGGRSPQRLNIY